MRAFITGRGLLSPAGRTPEALRAAFDKGEAGPTGAVVDLDWVAPGARTQDIGIDRGTALAMEAARAALAEAGLDLKSLGRDRLGILLASRHGSLARLAAAVTDAVCPCPQCLVAATDERNAAVPAPVGMCDTWHRLRTLTARVTGGYLSGLMALRRALDEIQTGEVRTLLVGSADELPAARRADAAPRGSSKRRAGLSECGVFVVLEEEARARSAGRQARGEVLACVVDRDTGVAEKAAPRVLVGRLTGLLAEAGIRAGDVSTVVTSGLGNPLIDAYERAAVDAVFLGCQPRRVEVSPFLGNTMSGHNLVQALAGLACEERHGGMGPVLVVSADPAGYVGAGLFARAA